MVGEEREINEAKKKHMHIGGICLGTTSSSLSLYFIIQFSFIITFTHSAPFLPLVVSLSLLYFSRSLAPTLLIYAILVIKRTHTHSM